MATPHLRLAQLLFMSILATGTATLLAAQAGPQGLLAPGQGPIKAPTRSFATEADALEWIARRTEALRAGETLRHRDQAGRLVGLTVVQMDVANGAGDIEAKVLAELGGDDGQVVIGNRTIALRAASAPSALGGEHSLAITAAKSESRCSGPLCTDNESFKHNYYLYRSIGSETTVTSGSGRRYVKTIPGNLLFDFPGLPVCSPAAVCPTGSAPEPGGSCSFKCYTPTSSAIHLSAVFYAKAPNGLPLPALTREIGPKVGTSAEVKLTQWGVLLGSGGVKSQCSSELGGPIECSLVGVCTRHETRNASGRVVAVTTAAGSTTNCGI